MKTLFYTLANTYKAVRLLSNPAVSALLERELAVGLGANYSHARQQARLNSKQVQNIQSSDGITFSHTLSTKNTFFHKYYVVQVTN